MPIQTMDSRPTGPDPQISHRPDVRPAKVKHQEHLGGPLADATYHRELIYHLLIRQSAQSSKSHRPLRRLGGKVQNRAQLCSGKPGAPQRFGVSIKNRSFRDAASQHPDKTTVDRLRRPARQLLVNDRAGE